MQKIVRVMILDDLRRKLMRMDYEKLNLKYLNVLKTEVDIELNELMNNE